MFNIREKFDSVFGVPASWYRRVARFINNLAQGTGIQISKPDNPSPESPVLVGVDVEWLHDQIEMHGGDGVTTGDVVGEEATHEHFYAIKSCSATPGGEVVMTIQKLKFEGGRLKAVETNSEWTFSMYRSDV